MFGAGGVDLRRLLSWQGVLACFVALMALLAIVTFLPRLAYPSLSAQDLRGVPGTGARIALQNARYQLQNDFRSELLQILAALFVVAGAAATWQQIRIAREGQMTERFTRAIEHLGSDSRSMSGWGGIYALERLAMNSPADRSSITPILGGFCPRSCTLACWRTPGRPADTRPRQSMTKCRG